MEQISSETNRKAIAYNYKNLIDLYDHVKPDQIPVTLSRLRQYLLDGHKWYSKNVKNVDSDCLEYDISDVEELKQVCVKMLVLDGNYISFASKEEKFEVNLVPLNRYLKKMDIQTRLNKLVQLQSNMRIYLHENNITCYKECSDLLDCFRDLLLRIEKGDAFDYL